MLETPHNDQCEVGIECLECNSKCEDGFLNSIGECVVPAVFSAVAME